MLTVGSQPTLNERIARVLIQSGTRRPVVKSMSRVPDPKIDQMYTQEIGRNSTSGQLPSSLEWFTKTHRIQMHAAFLLLAYRRIHKSLRSGTYEGMMPDSIPRIAFTRTLTWYHEICGGQDNAIISSQRLYTLIRTFADAQSINQRGNEAAEIKLHHCATCKLPLIVPRHYTEYHCAEHKPKGRRSTKG
ncbi:TPA: FlhC family transcriptional regulator [Burkholderia cepacia]|jgi:hypothetical protein|uniref:Uncharacterized protein n=7 Tax=Burkholderia cepacia complex TaxID=87882 RepID=A0A286P6U5_9BURK|nr:FlhC family transcriptional regulator [Burkholderia lata]KKL36429.1 hypothetical protein WR31_24850 [Burkholderia contaminans LMG 23361]MBA9831007.1 hypothetical protein [Burkholderia contaminans]MBR8093582.1 hypothetical protein [Burkholderia cenocepacia]MCA8363501.1 FlhC family transcriptional regulator [Burkholderia cepacia]CAB3973570.1 Flagellar transcriptional regulator FlhC [Burkholderia aenigmatica]VBB17358.1 hypothetical protein BSTAB16_7573 [Burkholderia stabilis]HDR9761710.1 hyp